MAIAKTVEGVDSVRTVQFGALVAFRRVRGHDHLASLEGDRDERVVDLLEIDVTHGDGARRGARLSL